MAMYQRKLELLKVAIHFNMFLTMFSLT